GGLQTVPFADGDSNVQISFGSPRTYFVVMQLTSDAGSQTPNQLRVTHVTQGPAISTAEDRSADLPLALEGVADVASGIVEAGGTGTSGVPFSGQLVISATADEAREVQLADLDGDGDLDAVFTASGADKIAWHANDGSGNFGPEHVIE